MENSEPRLALVMIHSEMVPERLRLAATLTLISFDDAVFVQPTC